MSQREPMPNIEQLDLGSAAAILTASAEQVRKWLATGWLLSLERGDVEAFKAALEEGTAE